MFSNVIGRGPGTGTNPDEFGQIPIRSSKEKVVLTVSYFDPRGIIWTTLAEDL